jgi:hypothetical protein
MVYSEKTLKLLSTLREMSTSSFFNLYHSLTHGAEPFLRSRQLCSYSRTSQHFMEPEYSLLCSQEPSTGPYPEPDQFNPYHPILSEAVGFFFLVSYGEVRLSPLGTSAIIWPILPTPDDRR